MPRSSTEDEFTNAGITGIDTSGTRSGSTSQRPRRPNGQFVQSDSSLRSPSSLAKQRARQKSYIARRRRMSKRVTSSFARAVVVRKEGKMHWIPASTEDGLLFELMEDLIKDMYLESRRKRLAALKMMYFNRDVGSKDRLPTLSVRDAKQPLAKTKSVSVFQGCRFPFPGDSYEMDKLKDWLRKHERMLRVSVEDAKEICVKTFQRYVKVSDARHVEKYLYIGYPIGVDRENASSVPGDRSDGLVNEGARTDSSNSTVPSNPASPGGEGYQEGVNALQTSQRAQSYFEVRASKIMAAAEDDVLYRTLLNTLYPHCEAQLSISCHVWVQKYQVGNPPDCWCTLKKDLYKYCLLTSQSKTGTTKFRELKKYLCDQLEVLKLLRQFAGLPLYEGHDWSEEDTG